MIKKIIFFAIVSLVIATTGIAMAQDVSQTATQEEVITAQDLGVGEPTLLPDSKFYFLKNWKNAIQSVFTFSQEKKAELNLKIASVKLLEAQKLAEKTSNSKILEKATDLYNKQVEKINKNIEKFKGTATSSNAISKFLDKYIKQQILHTQILEKLEGKVPTSTMEKIKQNTEKHLEKFGQVMQKLEDKTKIQERLQKAFDGLKNNLPATTTIRQKLENIKEKLLNSSTTRQWGKNCVCTTEFAPVCGVDGKTYGNPCKAKCLNITIASQGPCGEKATTTDMVGGDKDEHGCIGSAGYSWCSEKQKCLRLWEEPCSTSTITKWKIYKNVNGRVEFSYPTKWSIVKENFSPPYPYNSIEIGQDSKESGVTISYNNNITADVFKNQTIDKILPCTSSIPTIKILECKKMIINGLEFQVITENNSGVKKIIKLGALENGIFYDILFVPGNMSNGDIDKLIKSINVLN